MNTNQHGWDVGGGTVNRLLLGMALVMAILAGWIVWRALTLGQEETGEGGRAVAVDQLPAADRPPPPRFNENAWAQLTSSGAGALRGEEGRFRLAGTFFRMGAVRDDERLAILDDLTANRQSIVNEGDSLEEGYEVVRIYQERVILRRDGMEITLTLSFRDAEEAPATTGEPVTAAAGSTEEEEPALETTRFGKRIGENRWVVRREALLEYYQELLDEPERIASVYLSMKPDMLDGEVAGYRIAPEGEDAFFTAVGLREGDRIRKVNSMNMTSQARAEYFISEFMKERLSAVVIDIEREGREEKMIYLLR
jgi:type II secretion system protein C